MDVVFRDFEQAHQSCDGYLLASTITPAASKNDPARLYDILRGSNAFAIRTDADYATVYNVGLTASRDEKQIWSNIFITYYKVVKDVVTAEEGDNTGKGAIDGWSKTYKAWKDLFNLLHQGYQKGFEAWTIPCLYVAGKYLRVFAMKADRQTERYGNRGSITFGAGMPEEIGDVLQKNANLEDAGRQISRIFSLCLSDRNPWENSRKFGIYYTTNLLFKTYFKLNSIRLGKNIIQALQAGHADLPPLSAYNKADQVAFEYYVGVIHFLQEDYVKAESHLSRALSLSATPGNPAFSSANTERILTYLVPTRLLTGIDCSTAGDPSKWTPTSHSLFSPTLLAPYPTLSSLFTPLSAAIKRASLADFDAALAHGQDFFIRRRIFLTLERGRDIVLRNLFRKVFLAAGFERQPQAQTDAPPTRRTRITIQEFTMAMHFSLTHGTSASGHLESRTHGQGAFGTSAGDVDRDEVECVIANLIYKGLMKGYISREHGVVVLSKKGTAFPGTGV